MIFLNHRDAKALPPFTSETIYCTTLHLNMLYGNILFSNVKLQTIFHAKKQKGEKTIVKKKIELELMCCL